MDPEESPVVTPTEIADSPSPRRPPSEVETLTNLPPDLSPIVDAPTVQPAKKQKCEEPAATPNLQAEQLAPAQAKAGPAKGTAPYKQVSPAVLPVGRLPLHLRPAIRPLPKKLTAPIAPGPVHKGPLPPQTSASASKAPVIGVNPTGSS